VSLYREQVRSALDALEIRAADVFYWLDRRHDVDAPSTAMREGLLTALADRLYRDFYCQGFPTESAPHVARPPAAKADFIAALSRANSGRGSWSPGWTVVAVSADSVTVRRDGLEMIVPAGLYKMTDGGLARVLLPHERLGVSPGHYVAVGNIDLEEEPPLRAERIYFNVRADGAARLVAAVTRLLNAQRTAFRLKVLDDPLLFSRRDAAVLFVPFSSGQVAGTLRRVGAAVGRSLDEGVPALTKQIARGVGFAESPPAESFGAHRCRLIAAGAVAAFEAGMTEAEDRMRVVDREFVRAGLTLDMPYLEPEAGPVDGIGSVRDTRGTKHSRDAEGPNGTTD
jgi:hypothetical protein